MREPGRGLVQASEGVVGGRVIERQELVVVLALIHDRADPLHLGRDMILLVVARQDDRDIGVLRGRNAHRRRGYYRFRRFSDHGLEGYRHGDGSDIQTFTLKGRVCSGGAVRAFSSMVLRSLMTSLT